MSTIPFLKLYLNRAYCSLVSYTLQSLCPLYFQSTVAFFPTLVWLLNTIIMCVCTFPPVRSVNSFGTETWCSSHCSLRILHGSWYTAKWMDALHSKWACPALVISKECIQIIIKMAPIYWLHYILGVLTVSYNLILTKTLSGNNNRNWGLERFGLAQSHAANKHHAQEVIPVLTVFKALFFPLYYSSFLRVSKVSSTRKVAVKCKGHRV